MALDHPPLSPTIQILTLNMLYILVVPSSQVLYQKKKKIHHKVFLFVFCLSLHAGISYFLSIVTHYFLF